MAKHVIHLSEKEATATDVATLLAHVRSGADVVIDNGKSPFAVLQAVNPTRTISQCIALAKAHEVVTGYAPVLDADFAEDVKTIISNRKPWKPAAWE